MTDAERNEAVARKLGWTEHFPDSAPGIWSPPGGVPNSFDKLPDFCGDIKAAWQIVEKLRSDGWRIIITAEGLNWACTIGTWLHEELADSACRAICLAFLKLP